MEINNWHALMLIGCLFVVTTAENHAINSGLLRRLYPRSIIPTSNLDSFAERKQNLSQSCAAMSHHPSYCKEHWNTECHAFMRSQNISWVPTSCINGHMPTKRQISEFFSALHSPFQGDEDCTEIEKWIVCSVIYPECNISAARIKLPCKEICTRGEESACRVQTLRRFHDLQTLIFGTRFIPSCEDLPSMEAGECDFPQFIADILDRNQKVDVKKKETDDPGDDIGMYAGIGVGVFIVLLLVIILVTFRFRRHFMKNSLQKRSMSLVDIHTIHRNMEQPKRVAEGSSDDGWDTEQQSLETLIDIRSIPCFEREKLIYQEYLGEGEFGKVVKCSTTSPGDASDGGEMTLVAVKYLKADASDALETNFLEEVKILSQFKHPHVIPLLGVCIEPNGPKSIVLEFMKYGDLNQYLRERSGSYYASSGGNGYLPEEIEYRSPDISFMKLLFIANQIADGISYLASKRFVHRDLATRNILVGLDMHVKIADFGMARDVYESNYYRVDSRRLLPLRWLSPECLTTGKFTVYSDIWAFGILLWELFTYGMQPYSGYSNEEICDRIRRHKLLEKPYGCPKQVYELMKSCWKFEPTARKPCSHVNNVISQWLDEECPFIDIAWKHLLFRPMCPVKGEKMTKDRKYLSAGEITL